MALDHKARCDEVVERVTDYLEGAISAREREALEQHVLICSGCCTYLEQLRGTRAKLRALPRGEAPSELAIESLLARYRRHLGA